MSGRPEGAALAALFSGAVAIAFSPLFVRISDVDPVASAFFRVALATPVLFLLNAWMPAAGRQSRPRSLRDLGQLAVAGFFFAGDLALWHWSIAFTTIANSTLLANAAPIFVTLGSWMLFAGTVTRTFLVGLVVAMAGLVVLIGESARIGGDHLLGDLLGVATAVFYAGYLLSVSRLARKYSTICIMAWSGLVTSLLLLPLAWLSSDQLLPSSLTGWLVLLGLAWFSHAGGQSLIAFALGRLPATFSSVGLLVQPLTATLLAWVLLNETLSLWQVTGGAVVLLGIYLARRGSSPRAVGTAKERI